jgi:hypothetical protein
MDMDNELARAKWLLFSAALLLVSCCITYGEAVYLVKGRQTDATITRVYEETLRGRFGANRGQRLTVEYSFAEPDGTRRRDSDTVSLDWDIPSTGKIPVQYTPGAEGRSRLAGHANWFGIGFFAVSVVLLVLFALGLYREMADTSPRSKKGRAVKKG